MKVHQILKKAFFAGLLTQVSFCLVPMNMAMAGDWVTSTQKDETTQMDSCVATVKASKQKLPFELSVVYKADSGSLPEIYLKLPAGEEVAQTQLVKVSSKESQPMVLIHAATSAEDQNIYWYAPRSLSQLIKLIKEDNSLDVLLNPKSATPTKLQISLSGSSNAVSQAAKCSKTKTEQVEEYLTLLNQTKVSAASEASDQNGAELLAATKQGFTAFLKVKGIETQIAAVKKEFDSILQKEKKDTADLTAKQSLLSKSTDKMNALVADQDKNKQILADLTGALPELQQKVTAQEQAVADQLKIYNPAKAQVAPLENAVAQQRRQVNELNQAISSSQSSLQQNQSYISQTSSQMQSMQSQLSSSQSQWSSVAFQAQRAEEEYRRFDFQREVDMRLRSDWSYQALVRSQFDKERRARDISAEYDRLIWEMNSAVAQTKQCAATPGQDCSQISTHAQMLIDREKTLFQDRKRANADAESGRWQITATENNVQQQVRNEQNQLQAAYDSAMRNLNDLRSTIESLNSSLQNAQSQISQAQANISQIQASLASLRSQLQSAQSQLSAASSALASKKAEIGLEQIEATLSGQQKDLSDLRAQLKANIDGTAKVQSALKTLDASIKQLAPVIAKQTADVTASQSVLDATHASMTAYNEKKAPLDNDLSTAQVELLNLKEKYQQLYNYFLSLLAA